MSVKAAAHAFLRDRAALLCCAFNLQGMLVPTRKKERPKPPSFRSLMTFHLHRVARISERISEQYYRKHLGLSLPECRVIGITAGYETVSFKAVASAANLEKSYASRVVSALHERGLIEKQANPDDSRSVRLRLTPEGCAVHEQTYALATRLNELLQEPFRRAEVGAFVEFLGVLERQLDQAGRLLVSGNPLPARAIREEGAREERAAPEDLMPEFVLDRALARQFYDMLGRYLESDN